MSLESVVEEIIRDAMARGEFDHLPGAGKPLDHEAYFALPEDQRLALTALKNAGYVPEEVDLLREIKAHKEKLAGMLRSDQARASEQRDQRQDLETESTARAKTTGEAQGAQGRVGRTPDSRSNAKGAEIRIISAPFNFPTIS